MREAAGLRLTETELPTCLGGPLLALPCSRAVSERDEAREEAEQVGASGNGAGRQGAARVRPVWRQHNNTPAGVGLSLGCL